MKKLIIGAAALLVSVSVNADVLVLKCNGGIYDNYLTYNSDTKVLGLNGDDFEIQRTTSKKGVTVNTFKSVQDSAHKVIVLVSDAPSVGFQESRDGEVIQQGLCVVPASERI